MEVVDVKLYRDLHHPSLGPRPSGVCIFSELEPVLESQQHVHNAHTVHAKTLTDEGWMHTCIYI